MQNIGACVLEVLALLWAEWVRLVCRVCIPVQLRLKAKVECATEVKSGQDGLK
jgi:hypothetical protein